MPIILNAYLDIEAGVTHDCFLVCPVGLTVREVRLCANAVGADGSNYLTLSVQNRAGTTTYATRATNSSGFAVGVVESLTLANGDELDFAAGDAIKLRVAATGSGAAAQISVNVLCDLSRDYS
tara:strand:+ start:99 stop:467 length:369 start_codon:yes stop_codon:yes gene_type:complete